jgi:hypothetical protein
MAEIRYDQNDASRVTHEHLPPELKDKLTVYQVDTILEMKFLADREDIHQTVRMCEKVGLDVTFEMVEAVALAEEVYLRQIGAM